jgi:hypothetical protein
MDRGVRTANANLQIQQSSQAGCQRRSIRVASFCVRHDQYVGVELVTVSLNEIIEVNAVCLLVPFADACRESLA